MAVWARPTQSWLDFSSSPGQQAFALPLPGDSMALSLDRSFALVAAGGIGGGVARIVFDYANPANPTATWTTSLNGYVRGMSLSPDGQRACVTASNGSASPVTLVIIDASTGFVLHSVPLGVMGDMTTTVWQDASLTATCEPFGAGCAGTLGFPTLAAQPGLRPALGSTFTEVAGGLPHGIAILHVGLSNTLFGGVVPLPFPLAAIGMPGCNLLVDPLVSVVLVGPGNSATWSLAVPSTQSLFGTQVFSQSFPLDPPANSLGFSASNGTIATLGF